MVLVTLAIVSGVAFVHYGVEILRAPRLVAEFDRYGLPEARTLVGVLEILGGVGVMLGLAFAPLGVFAAAGLALLMAIGLAVRIRVGDGLALMAPAATLLVINGVLVVLFVTG